MFAQIFPILTRDQAMPRALYCIFKANVLQTLGSVEVWTSLLNLVKLDVCSLDF